MSSNTIHLIQHPANPFFISYQCPKCDTWNCFNFTNYIIAFSAGTSRNFAHWCRKCSKSNSIKTFTATDIILRKHNIVLDPKLINYDVDALYKLYDLKQFYEILGSANEKPNSKLIDFNPYSDMFKD